MNRLKQKLKSESGASILLALLFFLICTLVAAAVLMAAVSNAGKIKSNQEMHQKYLAVSSALELVCDDLLSAEYRGQYTVTVTQTPKTDSDGKLVGGVFEYTYSYNQVHGEYNCELGKMLLDELDAIFAEQMKLDVEGFLKENNKTNIVNPLSYPGTENKTHTLTISAPATGSVKMLPVQVFVTLDRKSYTINLTARLVDDAAYGMEAELTPTASNVPHAAEQLEADKYQTEPMTWKLGWITKASQK